ncbi:hypothetical protein HPB49_000382 [Dermacentor silvarum]|uniref:Uncharacterized protein n=1 Tax=Dermacentor silvarum TaxID=543639 RepID=A0ACB8DHW2_DERSI|nr:hypothetical protein HPB49_000382 [Dermacentor silvarum]
MEGNRAASSAENEKHKTHWSDDETRALLKVWEDHLSDLRKTKRNLKVYVAIAECLRAQGVEKSVKEIKSKIENLGNRYRNLSRKTTGQGAITWRFYKDISRFLGSLPMNDSSLTEETCGEDATVEIIFIVWSTGRWAKKTPSHLQHHQMNVHIIQVHYTCPHHHTAQTTVGPNHRQK